MRETEEEEADRRPVGNTEWLNRSVSVIGLMLTFLTTLAGGVTVYVTSQVRASTTEYQVQSLKTEVTELHAQYTANQGQMESVRVQLALINEKLGRLTEKQK